MWNVVGLFLDVKKHQMMTKIQSFSDVRVRRLLSESENFGLWKPVGLGLSSVFVCLRIYTLNKSTFHKKYPKFQFFFLKILLFPL
jgi:hypothetical protein